MTPNPHNSSSSDGASDPDDRSNQSPKLQNAMHLITALCDERITADRFKELQTLVCTDREVCWFYVQMMHLHSGLYYFASAIPNMMDAPGSNSELRLDEEDDPDDLRNLGMNETMVLPAMTASVDLEAGEDLLLPGPVNDPRSKPAPRRNPTLIKGGVAAGLTIILGLLAHFVPLMSNPSPADYAYTSPVSRPLQYIASIELGSKPVWEVTPYRAAGFVAGESLLLKSGAVQLRLNRTSQAGGRLVIEGPAEVRFISESEIRVSSGRMVANFPGGGLIVQCPTGSIEDLGTEFGVSVNPRDGNSEVEVFEGQISAALSNTASTQPAEPLILKVGQAAVLSQTSVTKSPQGAIPQRYICNLANEQVTALDATDLISGGDGTTHRHGIAVDATNGAIGTLEPVGMRTGDGKYHPIRGFPVVDGAFVPDGTHGPMTVDSAGHTFQFTPTTNSLTNQIRTGGPIPWPDTLGISTVIAGVDYSLPEHAIICTHANNAITLDLDAVRRIYPDRTLTRFHCHFANSYVNGLKGAVKVNPVASTYVLVDGVSRYEKLGFTNQDGMFAVDIPIAKSDRFLTLAAVDDGKEIDRDWILWTDARLEMSSGN